MMFKVIYGTFDKPKFTGKDETWTDERGVTFSFPVENKNRTFIPIREDIHDYIDLLDVMEELIGLSKNQKENMVQRPYLIKSFLSTPLNPVTLLVGKDENAAIRIIDLLYNKKA